MWDFSQGSLCPDTNSEQLICFKLPPVLFIIVIMSDCFYISVNKIAFDLSIFSICIISMHECLLIMFYQVAVCDLMSISLNIAVCGVCSIQESSASFCLSVLYPHHLPSIRRELFYPLR